MGCVMVNRAPNVARRRRRLDVILLMLAAVVVGVVSTSVAVASGGERVTQLWVGATVAADGSARVTEVIDWDFGPGRSARHLPHRSRAAHVRADRDLLPGRAGRVRRQHDGHTADPHR